MRAYIALAGALALTACVSVDEPVQTGRDSYMITADAVGAMVSKNSVTHKAIKKAGEFCTKQGKAIEVTNTQSAGVRGWVPADGSVTFMCLDPNDPAYGRSKLRPAANVVIENRNGQ